MIQSGLIMSGEITFFHCWYSHLGFPWVNMAHRMRKHQVLIYYYSQFYIDIEWLKHFTTLEACRLDSQWHTFSKWATNIRANLLCWCNVLRWIRCLCDVTLSVYPHRAGLKNMPEKYPTVARHIFQACPVWIYTQSNITQAFGQMFENCD
jgi:hypothetical protein